MKPEFKEIDLSLCYETSSGMSHDGINTSSQYLAVIDGRSSLGKFIEYRDTYIFDRCAILNAKDTSRPYFQALYELTNQKELKNYNKPDVTISDWKKLIPEYITIFEKTDDLFDNGWFYGCAYGYDDYEAVMDIVDEDFYVLMEYFNGQNIGPFGTELEAIKHCCENLLRKKPKFSY